LENVSSKDFKMKKLRELRKGKGMTLAELAVETGFRAATLQRYEAGQRKPDYKTLLVLADYFGVTADEMIRGYCE
jgi:transcriptional regulator with XRE-family HTH domain